MRVRNWQDVLEDVVESDRDPDQWRAVAGDRRGGVGEDLFLAHPGVGVFQMKTYAKNPFEVKGVGARVARQIDDDLDPLFPEEASGRFGIQSPVEGKEEAKATASRIEDVIKKHADEPTDPDAMFDDVMTALESPAFGPMEYDQHDRPDPLDDLTSTFDEAETLLSAELDDLVDDDGVGRGFQ